MTTAKEILRKHLNEKFDYSHRIDVEPVRNQTGSVRYNTRKLNPQLEGDDLFIIGVRE